ncbi:MAG TPA: helix-turn-helix domain-containing protein [Stellaceae bacterium]|nr:helix-turn-helix domain-containing protein [Stellaceae bacterium]
MPARSAAPDPCARCDARGRSVCNAIDDPDLHRLAAMAVVTFADPGSTFIGEGEPADHFFNITRGTVKLFKLLPDGRRQITGFCRAGDFLGLAVSRTYAFSAEAVDRVRFCRFSRRRLEGLLDDFPAFERRLLDFASNELVAAQEQMLLLGRKTARERVASFLLSQEDPHTAGEAGMACLPMTRTDIADYLGLTIETVSRTLSQLKRDRVIRAASLSEIEFADRARLEAIAAGDADGR